MEKKDLKKIQVFNLKLDENEVAQMISMLLEFPGKQVYNVVRKMEVQTMEQRKLPDDKKEWMPDETEQKTG